MGKKRVVTDHTPPLEGMVYQTVEHFDSYDGQSQRFETTDIEQAHVITSMVRGGTFRDGVYTNAHKPVLDIDFPAKLIPSSTPGHFHLYLDREVPWEKYVVLLEALEGAGILEPGYVGASLARGFTAARLPWIKKGEERAVIMPRCIGCGHNPNELPEYAALAKDEGYEDAIAAVRGEEGTYNPANGHFWCTSCYVKAGQPLGVAA